MYRVVRDASGHETHVHEAPEAKSPSVSPSASPVVAERLAFSDEESEGAAPISEATASRIADALERIAEAMESDEQR